MTNVLFGVVTDTKDPEGLGRAQVELSSFSGDIILPWLRVMQPMASNASGILWLPEKDDQVVVLAGPGGIQGMVVLGCLYSGKRKPKVSDADGKNNIKQILTRGGNEITLDDTSGSEKITIQTKDGKVKIEMDKAGSKFTLEGDTEVMIKSTTKVAVDGGTAIELTGTNIDLKSDAAITIKGSASVKVEAPAIDINGSATVTIAGGMISLG